MSLVSAGVRLILSALSTSSGVDKSDTGYPSSPVQVNHNDNDMNDDNDHLHTHENPPKKKPKTNAWLTDDDDDIQQVAHEFDDWLISLMYSGLAGSSFG